LAAPVAYEPSTHHARERGGPGGTELMVPREIGYVAPPSSESENAIESAGAPAITTCTESGFPGGMYCPLAGCWMWSATSGASAAAAFNLPAPQTEFGTLPVNASARAVDWSRALIADGLAFAQSGCARRSPIVPATMGDDMLVPASIQCRPSSITSAGLGVGVVAMDRADVTPNPGAEMSGFTTPSRRGPVLEKEAIEPRVGVGFQQYPIPSDAIQQLFVTCAATPMTESALAGVPTTVLGVSPFTHCGGEAPGPSVLE
jgi:hypothetical protein